MTLGKNFTGLIEPTHLTCRTASVGLAWCPADPAVDPTADSEAHSCTGDLSFTHSVVRIRYTYDAVEWLCGSIILASPVAKSMDVTCT